MATAQSVIEVMVKLPVLRIKATLQFYSVPLFFGN